MCFNAVALNAVTKISKHHVPDTMSIIDELFESSFMSLLDLKGAFFNHPVDPTCYTYLGFKT